jgi:hypothetical protein
MLSQKETDKTNIETAPDIKNELDDILSATLTVDSIDTYADDALNDLIDLVGRTTEVYSHQPTVNLDTKTATETAAFAYYGLGDVETMLDHIADKANELRDIDGLISRVETVDTIITPTDLMNAVNPSGMGGEFQKKMTIPRLKTLLFILSNEFAIDLHDDEQLGIQKGLLGSDMMRKESYYLVTAPTIERTVLVCDEEGNATFVFDNAVLKESDVSSADLQKLTKTDLNDLIAYDPRIGKRIIFTDDFVRDMISVLGDKMMNTQDPASSQESVGKYLYPTPPEGYLAIAGIFARLGVGHRAVSKVVGELGATLGEARFYRFGTKSAIGYSPEQQDMIRQRLEEKGSLAPKAPEGYLSERGVTQLLGVGGWNTIKRAVGELGPTLGETRVYKFGPKSVAGYSPEQQETIRQHLEEKRLFAPEAPEGYLSGRGVAQLLGVGKSTVNSIIEELGLALGETRLYKIGSKSVTGYSPEQQRLIRMRLKGNS